jgi:hypothetical protein
MADSERSHSRGREGFVRSFCRRRFLFHLPSTSFQLVVEGLVTFAMPLFPAIRGQNLALTISLPPEAESALLIPLR